MSIAVDCGRGTLFESTFCAIELPHTADKLCVCC